MVPGNVGGVEGLSGFGATFLPVALAMLSIWMRIVKAGKYGLVLVPRAILSGNGLIGNGFTVGCLHPLGRGCACVSGFRSRS